MRDLKDSTDDSLDTEKKGDSTTNPDLSEKEEDSTCVDPSEKDAALDSPNDLEKGKDSEGPEQSEEFKKDDAQKDHEQQSPTDPATPKNSELDLENDNIKVPTDDEDEASRLLVFTNYSNHLWTLRQSSYEHFDNAILTLSSALLALSVTFLKEAVPLSPLIHPALLICSWGAFAVVIASTLTSHIGSRKSIDCQLKNAEDYYINGNEECFNKGNKWTQITENLNWVSAIFFILAVLFTIVFVSINMLQENKRKEERAMESPKPTPSPTQERPFDTTMVPPDGPNTGATPPPMPPVRPAPPAKPGNPPKK